MAFHLEGGVQLRLKLPQDLKLEYRCFTEVSQEFSNAGKVLGKKEHAWDTKITRRVLRLEGDIAHLLTVSEPVGELPQEPIMGSQVARQVSYCQLDNQGQVREAVGNAVPLSFVFPLEAVSVGSSWERATMTVLPGMPHPAQCTNTYVLQGAERAGGYDCVCIEVRSSAAQFEMVLPDGKQRANVISETSGRIFFVPELGLPVRLEMTTRSIPKIEGFAFNTITNVVQDLVRCDQP